MLRVNIALLVLFMYKSFYKVLQGVQKSSSVFLSQEITNNSQQVTTVLNQQSNVH